MVTVAGNDVQSYLSDLQNRVGEAGIIVEAENLHFSVCHTYGRWTAEDVASLIKKIKLILQKPSTAFMNDKFICNHTAFFNTDKRLQGMLHSYVPDPSFTTLQLTCFLGSSWCVSK